ncbi:unnamed protein product, partial [Linum tenue]
GLSLNSLSLSIYHTLSYIVLTWASERRSRGPPPASQVLPSRGDQTKESRSEPHNRLVHSRLKQ